MANAEQSKVEIEAEVKVKVKVKKKKHTALISSTRIPPTTSLLFAKTSSEAPRSRSSWRSPWSSVAQSPSRNRSVESTTQMRVSVFSK